LATQLPTTHLSTLSLHDALPISPLGTSGAREAEIVEELALEFQESYERALRNGLTAGEAWLEVQKRSPSWGQLAGELRSALEEPDVGPPEAIRRTNMFARFCEDLK